MINFLDPFGIAKTTLETMEAAARNPEALLEQQAIYNQRWLDLVEQSVAAFSGEPHHAVIRPEPGDKRFAHPAWSENASLEGVKEAYLLATEALVSGIEAI